VGATSLLRGKVLLSGAFTGVSANATGSVFVSSRSVLNVTSAAALGVH